MLRDEEETKFETRLWVTFVARRVSQGLAISLRL